MYEPERDADKLETLSGEDDSALEAKHLEEPNQVRLANTDWCSFGHSNAMSAAKVCVCCQEMVALRHKLEQEQQTLDCITQKSAFYRVDLEREVLRTALAANIDRLREPLVEPLPNSYDEFYEQGCTFADCIWFLQGNALCCLPPIYMLCARSFRSRSYQHVWFPRFEEHLQSPQACTLAMKKLIVHCHFEFCMQCMFT